jgi:uncharacterized protein (DUF885 family)
MSGAQGDLVNLFSQHGYLKLDNLQDHKDAITFLKNIPKYLDQIKTLLQEGVKSGLTYHEASMSRVRKQFERLEVKSIEADSGFYVPFKNLKGDSNAVVAIRQEALEVIRDHVLPAFTKLKGYVLNDYSKHLRSQPGLSSLPGKKFEFFEVGI